MKNLTKSLIVFSILYLSVSSSSFAQLFRKDYVGWGCDAMLPSVSFDADKGFQYCGLIEFLDHGKPSIYPLYKHSIYGEWSHTTKGNDLKQIKYDSEYLIPGIRTTGIVRLETEESMDFYGFNGFESNYNPDYEDEGHDDYISRMYYRMGFRSLRIKTDFQGPITGKSFRWYAGLAHYNIKAESVDLEKLNSKLGSATPLPDLPSLYDEYVTEGIIPANQAEGGFTNLIKIGLVADTRDFDPYPTKGIWTEACFIGAPGFIGNEDPYTAFVITHRHYLPLVENRLVFAYRLNYQTTLSGSAPWYMLSFKPDTFIPWNGLGGNKTMRGILRNRVVGDGAVLGNFELRWKFVEFYIGEKLKPSLTLSAFTDAAKITKQYSVQPNMTGDTDGLHISYGGGLHIQVTPNFIIAVDYGLAADERDGKSGMYIGLDFLF